MHCPDAHWCRLVADVPVAGDQLAVQGLTPEEAGSLARVLLHAQGIEPEDDNVFQLLPGNIATEVALLGGSTAKPIH